MSTLQAFLLGVMVCIAPSLLLLSIVLAALPRAENLRRASRLRTHAMVSELDR